MRIESYRISFVSRCHKCGQVSKNDYQGLGKSHAAWAKDIKGKGKVDWQCIVCGHQGEATIWNVQAIKSK